MSYFELPVRVECPHCGEEHNECAEFNMLEADNCGVDSRVFESFCSECKKDFWFTAYCSFEVEPSEIYKKEPKRKEKP